jgi:hypothetical protein
VVELAALEMLCTGNRTVGSNPTLSARIKAKVIGSKVEVKTTDFLKISFSLTFVLCL